MRAGGCGVMFNKNSYDYFFTQDIKAVIFTSSSTKLRPSGEIRLQPLMLHFLVCCHGTVTSSSCCTKARIRRAGAAVGGVAIPTCTSGH